MLVEKSQLIPYNIAEDLYFPKRTGSGNSRDKFFVENSSRLIRGLYCAIGNDIDGWQLELYNGVNWNDIDPDEAYALIITSEGLKALANVKQGGIQLFFSGIKILNTAVKDPVVPLINWTDTQFLQAGETVFTCGTNGSPHSREADDTPSLNKILKWRFNNSTGGLQYILTLPPEGLGSQADNGLEEYKIGTIGLYVKDPNDYTTDVLFGVATLPETVTKYGTNIDREGNTLKFYFNTVLNNLGLVSNLQIMAEDDHNIPEVPNESLLLYPSDPIKRPYNCYVVDSLYGTNIPALAVPRVANPTDVNSVDWAFFRPSDDFTIVDADKFADNVKNYMFVYWNATTNLYELGEGKYASDTGANDKLPIGIRVGNSIIYSGEIVNNATSYQYSIPKEPTSGGNGYRVNDELLIAANNGLTFKVVVTDIKDAVEGVGSIDKVKFLGPKVGNISLESPQVTLPAIYDPRSQLPRSGKGARFTITQLQQTAERWNFPANWLNKPLYCDKNENAGKPTLTKTDAFLGWCTSSNSIRLALDLRNEATTTLYGTTRYATDTEVKESYTYPEAAEQTAITPKTLKTNYLQITKPTNTNQPGSSLANPQQVESFVRFGEIILGKSSVAPYDTSHNPGITDSNVAFYGCAYRAEWADLAEFYESDEIYEPGTLITFGKGLKEISAASIEVNGIISTKPGYQLGIKKDDHWLPVALTGRVPVLFDGLCMPMFGDKVYLSQIKKGCASTVENGKCIGKIIQKDFGTSNLIECVVRIEF